MLATLVVVLSLMQGKAVFDVVEFSETYNSKWQQCAPCPAGTLGDGGLPLPECVAVETECPGSYAAIGCEHEKAATQWYDTMRKHVSCEGMTRKGGKRVSCKNKMCVNN